MSDKPLFVLGAGVDKCLHFPLMNDLMYELKLFKEGDGREIHEALRKHVKGMQFDFDRYAGEKGTAMGSLLLGGDGSVLENVSRVVGSDAVSKTPQVEAIRLVVGRLLDIRRSNDLSDEDQKVFTNLEGFDHNGTVDHLLDPSNVTFSDIPRRVLREALKQAIQETPEGRSSLYDLLLSLSNFEELLGDFFTGFFTKNITLQKRYFYLAWLFWAYIRVCESQTPDYSGSFYELVEQIGICDLITFNYTGYAHRATKGAAKYFHGKNDIVLDFMTRKIDVLGDEIASTHDLINYLTKLECTFGAMPRVKVPGLVPPLIMKPIMASEYLDWWAESAWMIESAKTIIVVGYSFAFADEHFNDLIRKRATKARIVAVDPFWDGVCKNVCRVTGETRPLVDSFEHGMSCRKQGRLAFYEAYADKMNIAQLQAIVENR